MTCVDDANNTQNHRVNRPMRVKNYHFQFISLFFCVFRVFSLKKINNFFLEVSSLILRTVNFDQ